MVERSTGCRTSNGRDSQSPIGFWAAARDANHRLSRDIDAFIDEPQYLALLSPGTTDVWTCIGWDNTAHYLKLGYSKGEIDFIVSGTLTDLIRLKRS
ncbi:hypothetical protein J2R96_002164 [Bradyrhizobium elkanii]|nr:hypothetical protein [Bradyrhizobium elkanii]